MRKVRRTDGEWKARLTPEQFAVTRRRATEPTFSGRYHDCRDPGTYVCVCCGSPLFRSGDKYDSGSGWPSFVCPATEESLRTRPDDSLAMRRTEVLCAACDAHLGHVFDDGPRPHGKRYCINSAALDLRREE